MGSSFELTLVSRPLRTAAILVFGALFAPLSAPAEIILDDFDDPAEVVAPEMGDEFVITDNVGTLAAQRGIRVALFGNGSPEGRFDSNLTLPSTLTGSIRRLNPATPISSPGVSVQSNYTFSSPTDFTEGGDNNAFLLDFLQVTSELPPSIFSILFRDANDYFLYFESPFKVRDAPFTLVVPFDRFTHRDGQPGIPDFTRIEWISVSMRASEIAGGGPDPLNFMMQLDRIRVGRLVPEPSTFLLSTFAAALLFSIRLHERHSILMRTAMPCCNESVGLHS